MRKLGVRSFFQRLFTDPKAAEKIIAVVNSHNNYFVTWDNNAFESDIIRAAIRPKSRSIGKLSATHIKGEGEKLKVNQEAWLKEILTYPNKYMTMQDLLEKMVTHRELYHNAFAYVERDMSGYPSAVYPITCSSAELLTESEQTLLKFYLMDGRNMIVNYDDIIHLRKDFNNGEFFGDSGNKAIKNIMDVITTTDQGIVAAVKNSAIIKWILKFKSTLRPEDVEIQVDDFVKNYLSIEKGGKGVATCDPRYDLEQVKPESFLPNAAQMKETKQRVNDYFAINEAIVQNKYDEDEWNAFFESELQPIIVQLSLAFTRIFFTRRERGFGNKIIFDATSLTYASMNTKLGLVQYVDRGIMSANEVREIMNLPAVDGGDVYVRRLDTAPISADEKSIENTGGETVEQKVLAV